MSDQQPTMTTDEYGDREWHLNRQLHRTDGPALEWTSGERGWYIRGQELEFSQWLAEVKRNLSKEDILRFLLLLIKQGNFWLAYECMEELVRQGINFREFAAIRASLCGEITPVMTIDADSNRMWMIEGCLHRTDGPAFESADGDREWWINGLLHRTDGPAVEYADGGYEWVIDNTMFEFDEWLSKVAVSDTKRAELIERWS
jgi:hypothetical protein